jgi:hypothetical protein
MCTSHDGISARIQSLLNGPIGSGARHAASESVSRMPPAFTTTRPPAPALCARTIHRVIVGSSTSSVAVDGFKSAIIHRGLAESQIRQSAYRYVPQLESTHPATDPSNECRIRVTHSMTGLLQGSSAADNKKGAEDRPGALFCSCLKRRPKPPSSPARLSPGR